MSTQKENKGLQSNVFFQWQHKGLGLGENALKAVSDPCCPQTDNYNLIKDLYPASPAINFGFNKTCSEINVTALVVTDQIVV